MTTDATPPPGASNAVRRFGRFELLELVGRSRQSMAWRVRDSRDGTEKLMVAPRTQFATEAEVRRWLQRAERAARLDHPVFLRPLEVGEQQRWPYQLYQPEGRALSVRLADGAAAGIPQEIATVVASAGRALASAHDAGLFHGDLQPWSLWLVGQDRVRVLGLEAATAPGPASAVAGAGVDADAGLVREGVARDIVGLGILMHWQLTGQKPLGLEDVGEVLERLAPHGADVLEVAADSQLNLPRALKVICNRATDRQEAFRYRSMRTLVTAVEGWLDARQGGGRGFLQEVRDKLRSGGGFPISNEAAERFSRIEHFEEERTSYLSEMLLDELPLTIELLRSINARQQRDDRRAGTASVLTLKRAVALFGLRGVRRVALGLKRWPGTLKPHEAGQFMQWMDRCHSAARVAQGLRPAGFDAEIVFVVTVLQNLGRLALAYHFPEQAGYVRSVMFRQTERAGTDERRVDPEMTEETACFAVLGVDMDAIAGVALQHLGLDNDARNICRRMPLGAPVHASRRDDDMLRITASCANEAVDALQWPADRAALELSQVMQRYGRVLKVDLPAMKRLLMPHGLDGETLRAWIRRTPYAEPDPEDDLF